MSQQTVNKLNFKSLIPTILQNLRKVDFSNPDRASVFNKLNALPRPSKEELEYLYFSDYCYLVIHSDLRDDWASYRENSTAVYYGGYSPWTARAVGQHLVSFYALDTAKTDSTFLERVYRDSKAHNLLEDMVKGSAYTAACLNHLMNKESYDLQMVAVKVCSIDNLQVMKKSSHEKVRLEAYKRLGPMEYLDEMLVDKSRHVRTLAAEWMPTNYEVPAKALSDRAYWSFVKILEKVSLNQIPMLLGNSNLKKSKSMVAMLQNRLDSKF